MYIRRCVHECVYVSDKCIEAKEKGNISMQHWPLPEIKFYQRVVIKLCPCVVFTRLLTELIHASDNCKVLFAEGCRLLQERLCRSRPQRPFTLLATVCCTSYASLSGLLYRTSYPKAYIRDRGLPILVLVRTSDTFRAPPTLKNPNFPSDELICR